MDLPPPASALDPAQIDQTVPGGATGDTDASHATPGGFSWKWLALRLFSALVVTALIEAKSNGWIVVDMKKEWKVIYP